MMKMMSVPYSLACKRLSDFDDFDVLEVLAGFEPWSSAWKATMLTITPWDTRAEGLYLHLLENRLSDDVIMTSFLFFVHVY